MRQTGNYREKKIGLKVKCWWSHSIATFFINGFGSYYSEIDNEDAIFQLVAEITDTKITNWLFLWLGKTKITLQQMVTPPGSW